MQGYPDTIFDFIIQSEGQYNTGEVQVAENWPFQMKEHLLVSFLFKHGKFWSVTNSLQYKQPFRNIILPILRLRYRAEDIDVKDIVFYVEDQQKQHLSFLIKKYWDDVFSIENDIDYFIDRAKEEKIDYGGCLVKKGKDAVPEVISLHQIAFCDQTDILSSPIGLKFNFSPSKLREKEALGWGNKANGADVTIEELIYLATDNKDVAALQGEQNKVIGKNIEVYVVRGSLPESYLNGKGDTVINQVQIVAFYHDKSGKKGVTLFKKKDIENVYKFHNPEEIFGRALGFGGVEELFDSQIWTNFAEIAKKDLLKAASKIIPWTTDPALTSRQKINDMENMEWISLEEGKQIGLVPTGSPNIALFTQSLTEWENHARDLGGASDPLLGKQPPAGTPFRLQERVVFEGKGLHEYRKGKYAKFLEEVLRDWVIPQMRKDILKGKKFLATLSTDEMQIISEQIAENRANKEIIEDVLNGKPLRDKEALKQKFMAEFRKRGNKKWIEILRDDFKDVEIKIKINIAGKQKDLVAMTDKIVNILRFVFSNPQGFQQVMQMPGMAKAFNDILEFSGLSPVDFAGFQATLPALAEQQRVSTKPLEDLTKRESVIA